jgi:expansin (peptidoglycan-binding protein)
MRTGFQALGVLLLSQAVACGSSSGKSSAGAGGAGGGGAPGAPAPTSCSAEATHTGQATFYTSADGSGNCGFDKTPQDLMVGAMNAADYAGAAACGACARLDGPDGSVTVRIVDQCPDCAQGNIDLSPEAFDRIANRSAGRVPITWEYVPCDVSGPIVYRFKEGSNQWWTAVQIRNSRYRIAKFEYRKNGAYVEVHREDYNYFVEPNGMGPGPYTFRVTDVYGDALVDDGIVPKEATEVSGKAQFPDCAH